MTAARALRNCGIDPFLCDFHKYAAILDWFDTQQRIRESWRLSCVLFAMKYLDSFFISTARHPRSVSLGHANPEEILCGRVLSPIDQRLPSLVCELILPLAEDVAVGLDPEARVLDLAIGQHEDHRRL